METNTMAKYCIKCGEEIHPKRVEILPNATTCVKCSDTKAKRSITVQLGEGDHTYNELIIMDADEYQRLEPYINPRAKIAPPTLDEVEEEDTKDTPKIQEFETSDDIVYSPEDYGVNPEEGDEVKDEEDAEGETLD